MVFPQLQMNKFILLLQLSPIVFASEVIMSTNRQETIALSPTNYRQWIVGTHVGQYFYPDVETTLRTASSENQAMYLLSQLRTDPGTVTEFFLDLWDRNGAVVGHPSDHLLLCSELSHFLSTTTMTKFVLNHPNGGWLSKPLPTSWHEMIIIALRNDNLKEFEVNIELDVESARRIRNEIGNGDYSHRTITIWGIKDESATRLLHIDPIFTK